MKTFFALHEIASQRGDGLRSEIVRLLERARNVALVRACTRPKPSYALGRADAAVGPQGPGHEGSGD